MKKKILVLGSSSFSGASLVNYLLDKNKYQLFGLFIKKKKLFLLPYKFNRNQKNFKEFKIDLKNDDPNKLINLITKIKPNIIIDFASICMVNESWTNPELYFQINVLSKIKLINFLSSSNFLDKYIYISTPEIFGSSKNYVDEYSNKFNPTTPYATSKLSFELLLKNYHQNLNFPLIISRFSNFFGPGQPIYRLIPKIIYCINSKKKFPLEGEGLSKRNFIFTNDFCDAIHKMILKGKIGHIYHFSGENFYNVITVMTNICKIMSYDVNKLIKKVKGRLGQDHFYKLSSKKTRNELKWSPKFSLIKGLKEVVIYYDRYIKKTSIKDLIYQDSNFKNK